MRIEQWIKKNTASLQGKAVAVTGSTGGLGQALCRHLAALGADLILLDRNPKKAAIADEQLQSEYPTLSIRRIPLDLEDMTSVRAAAEALKSLPVDLLILNAGAYSIPRKTCALGLDNVFQINFAAPYYLTRQLLPNLEKRQGRVVVVGSVAHTYSKTDPQDTDFSTRKKASLVYGNAKRYLMYAFLELSKAYPGVAFSVTHPGITFTGITAHYPKLIFALIKHPMKVIFMPPRKAARNIVQGMFESTEAYSWIGPRLFDVWGSPVKKLLKTADGAEIDRIFETAQQIYHLWQ